MSVKSIFSDLEVYLRIDIYNTKENYYEYINFHSNMCPPTKDCYVNIENNTAIIRVYIPEIEKEVYKNVSLSNWVYNEIIKIIDNDKELIKAQYEQIIIVGSDALNYKRYLKDKLSTLYSSHSIKEFKFLEPFLDELNTYLDSIFKVKKAIPLKDKKYSMVLNYNENEIESKILLLYNLLNQAMFINGEYNEFKNIFTGEKARIGVNWILLGKNHWFNKSVLIYFVEQLYKRGFIDKSQNFDLFKSIVYCFRDNNGDIIKNLKQSYDKLPIRPTAEDYKKIDEVLNAFE